MIVCTVWFFLVSVVLCTAIGTSLKWLLPYGNAYSSHPSDILVGLAVAAVPASLLASVIAVVLVRKFRGTLAFRWLLLTLPSTALSLLLLASVYSEFSTTTDPIAKHLLAWAFFPLISTIIVFPISILLLRVFGRRIGLSRLIEQ